MKLETKLNKFCKFEYAIPGRIGFDELLERVKKLPKEQILRFKNELDANQIRLTENAIKTDTEDLEAFLLRGPTFSEEQIQIIEETQKAVNKWRKK